MVSNKKLDQKFVKMSEALANKTRRDIFELLLESPSLSFNQIMKTMNIERASLAYHLKMLTKADLINNFYDKRPDIKDHSYYEISNFGKSVSELLVEKIDKTMELEQFKTVNFRNVSKTNIFTEGTKKRKVPDEKVNEETSDIVLVQGDNKFTLSEWKTHTLDDKDNKKLYASKFITEDKG